MGSKYERVVAEVFRRFVGVRREAFQIEIQFGHSTGIEVYFLVKYLKPCNSGIPWN